MLHRIRAPNGVVYYASPLLEAAGVPHAFSTRVGGVSQAPFSSLNLGNPGGCDVQDAPDHLEANYARLLTAIGCARRARCRLRQVHGAVVRRAMRARPSEDGCEGDALVGDDPDRVLAVRVADCVPVLLATGDGRVVAAVHAGWRGVIAGVVPAAVEAMLAAANGPDAGAADLVAAVGPCIGFDAFEVGPEVLAAFERAFPHDPPVRRRADGNGHVDLRGAVRRQLLAAGVPADRADVTDRCTVRDPTEFFSHRRDGLATGRMAAVVGARAGGDPCAG